MWEGVTLLTFYLLTNRTFPCWYICFSSQDYFFASKIKIKISLKNRNPLLSENTFPMIKTIKHFFWHGKCTTKKTLKKQHQTKNNKWIMSIKNNPYLKCAFSFLFIYLFTLFTTFFLFALFYYFYVYLHFYWKSCFTTFWGFLQC